MLRRHENECLHLLHITASPPHASFSNVLRQSGWFISGGFVNEKQHQDAAASFTITLIKSSGSVAKTLQQMAADRRPLRGIRTVSLPLALPLTKQWPPGSTWCITTNKSNTNRWLRGAAPLKHSAFFLWTLHPAGSVCFYSCWSVQWWRENFW